MSFKEDMVRETQEATGWAYFDMKWLSEKEASRENAWRRKKIKWLQSRLNTSFCNNKLHIGPLSPGCLTCGEGSWSCAFLTHRCPCNCFFCPEDKSFEPKPYAEGVFIGSGEDYAKYIDLFDYKGVSISGGDSISNLEGLIKYIRAIKKRCGNDVYTWAYTSGLKLNEQNLKKIRDAGLDEIRIDIAAIDYDTKPLEIATKWIKAVTVEIPVIPEDYCRLTSLLPKLSRIGIKHLNLHELTTRLLNYKAFIRRGYTFLHSPTIDVLESGNTALEILEYAIKNKIRLPINYCSNSYNNRMQQSGRLRRWASLFVNDYEVITDKGFVRRITIVEPPKLDAMIASLRVWDIDKKLWRFDEKQRSIVIHSSLIDKIKISNNSKCIYIKYYDSFMSNEPISQSEHTLKISAKKCFFINRSGLADMEPLCLVELLYFKDLFIDKLSINEFLIKHSGKKFATNDATVFKKSFEPFEIIQNSYHEIY